MSRDQTIALNYYTSVTRANTRLRALVSVGLLKRLDTPFFGQGLYTAGKQAGEIVGEHISPLLESRTGSPRFVLHALSTTNVRIALTSKADAEWRFEQQLWRKLNSLELRPDGLLLTTVPTFVEVDMGHVSSTKFKAKLAGYQALAGHGVCQSVYGFDSFRVLSITTGDLRARHLRQLLPSPGFDHRVQTFAEIGVAQITPWS